MRSQIMYIELKSDGLTGPARIGRVTFSATGRTVYYNGRALRKVKGFKANHADVETGERYWISGCKQRGGDCLYPGVIEIDDDVREAYWTEIRKMPESKEQRSIRCLGKYRK